jgi:hypothetical protein
MRVFVSMFIGALLVLLEVGCTKPPPALIASALASTNVVFQAHSQEPITLTRRGGDTLRSIVNRFDNSSHVKVMKDILPAFSGRFVLGNVRFGWVGSLLCLKDPDAERYYVVQDSILGKMSEVYLGALGPPPVHELSNEQWQEVIAVLENTK